MFSFILISIVAGAMADAKHEGACPEMKPVPDFDVASYQGVWYEIAKTPTEAEKNGNCGQAEYKLDGDVVKLTNSHVVDGVLMSIDGTAKLADDANNSAKLVVTFKFGDITSHSPLSVLTTDYTNYAIAYNCRYNEETKTHRENVWILSRTKTLEGEAKTTVDAFLKSNSKEIDESRLVYTDFSEEACKYSSSGVVTTQPDNSIDLKKKN